MVGPDMVGQSDTNSTGERPDTNLEHFKVTPDFISAAKPRLDKNQTLILKLVLSKLKILNIKQSKLTCDDFLFV